MSDSVQMPALGESVTEGTVTRWLKQVGERVEVDEPLLEVSTDKVDTEIPSPVSGVLQEILVQEDETVEVGAALAVIGDGSEPSSDGAAPAASSAPASAPEPEPSPAPTAQQDSASQQSAGQPAVESEGPGGGMVASPDGASGGSGGAGGSGGGDAVPVTMPALGESVTEGTVTRWLKAEGDTVEVDEPLLEVSTDKVDTEIPSPVAGTVLQILVAEDETVEVGARLALVGSASGGPSSDDDDAAAGGGLADEVALREEAAAQAQGQVEQKTAQARGDAPSPSSPSSPSTQVPAPSQSSPPSRQDAGQSAGQSDAGQPQRQLEQEAPAGGPEPEQAREDYNSIAPQTGGPVRPPLGEEPDKAPSGDVSPYVTPLVRKLAASEGVSLSSLTGTGVGGRIRKQDVLDAAARQRAEAEEAAKAEAAPAPAAPSGGSASSPRPAVQVGAKRGTTEKMTRLRKVIASRMVESLQVSAQLTSVVEVDVTRIARLRARAKDDFKAREGASLSFLPFITLAAIETLKQFPQVNASIEGDSIVYHPQENIGIAVDTERGLLVPVIKDAGDLNIAGIARRIGDLAKRTRDNKVTPDELGGGTFTITNTGSRGALFDTPIINQPQVAILGTGAVVKRPAVVTDADGGESIAIRSLMYLALSYDHRLVDGADAGRFLSALKARLEEGAFEADLGL